MRGFWHGQAMQRLAVYCGSRSGHAPEHGQAATALGRAMARRGVGLVYGAAQIGLMGTIADAVGAFPDPEMAALGQQPVLRELYRVRFQQSETWDGYRGATKDSLDVEIYEHWLASIGGASA